MVIDKPASSRFTGGFNHEKHVRVAAVIIGVGVGSTITGAHRCGPGADQPVLRRDRGRYRSNVAMGTQREGGFPRPPGALVLWIQEFGSFVGVTSVRELHVAPRNNGHRSDDSRALNLWSSTRSRPRVLDQRVFPRLSSDIQTVRGSRRSSCACELGISARGWSGRASSCRVGGNFRTSVS
jgi:hypothetical protein